MYVRGIIHIFESTCGPVATFVRKTGEILTICGYQPQNGTSNVDDRLRARGSVYIFAMNDDELWTNKAQLWHDRIGAEGDKNRRYNSDPVLWRMIGDPGGLDVLDAGCGTGYLAIQLARRGARVRAVDYSDGMLEQARRNVAESGLAISVAKDSCCHLGTIADASCDLIVSNYVLMDLEDLDGAVRNAARVLRDGGRFAVVMSHPCFLPEEGVEPEFVSYFDNTRVLERWGEFDTPFAYYHRPLTYYWKTFRAHGFALLDFEEPIIQPPYPPELDEETLVRWRRRPYSVAYLLQH